MLGSIRLWQLTAQTGRKVMIVLEELGLDYEPIYLNLSANQSKDEKHTKYNPNGRIPTLIDHKNNDFAIWSVPRMSYTRWGLFES